MASTALEIIKQVAVEVGEYGEYTTTSLGTTTTLITSRLVNTNLEPSELEDQAVLIESGNNAYEVRNVRRSSGLTKATGTITTADAFTNAVQSGVTFSTYGRVAPFRRRGVVGLLECLNTGVRKISVRDIINLTGVSSQVHYSLDTVTYPWLTDEWRVIAVQWPVTNADDAPYDLARNDWEWVSDAETRRLRFYGGPFSTAETVPLRVYRPGNSRLKLNAQLRATISAGAVSAVTVEIPGYYSAVPTVTASGGAGSGATFTAVLSGGTTGTVTSVTIGAGGTLYTSAPTLTVTRDAADTGWRDQTTQTAKLVSLTDETIANVDAAVLATKAEVYRAFAELRMVGNSVEEWQKKALAADAAVRDMVNRQPPDRTTGVANLRPSRVYPRGGGGTWWRNI